MSAVFDHAAWLVEDLAAVRADLEPRGVQFGQEQDFPREGTREVYVGARERPGRLLLVQPVTRDGPYAGALRRRGEGLHHVALAVPDLAGFLARIEGTGWLLHTASVRTMAQSQTAWLARPGVGTLVEIHQTRRPPEFSGALVTRIEVVLAQADEHLLTAFPAIPWHRASGPAGCVELFGEIRWPGRGS